MNRNTCVVVLIALLALPGLLYAGEGRPPSFRKLISEARPAVVCVTAARTPCKVLKDSFVDFINPFPLHEVPGDAVRLVVNIPLLVLNPSDRKALGSGFVISPDGYVLTNSHVVERANKVKVELPDRKIYKAKIVGQDRLADIALLKAELPEDVELPVLPLGNSDDVEQGDWVVAIGCPLALKWTATAGIVSYVGRSVGATRIDDLIQMEASLDSGNSGGPLINTKGEVVGINTAAIFMAENKGFAVPVKMATEIIDDLKEHGEPRRGMLGIVMTEITSETVEEETLAVDYGAFVDDVGFLSPAAKAGLEEGDVIVEFDGTEVRETRDLRRLSRNAEIDSKVKIRVYRGKEKRTLVVKMGKLEEPFRVF